MNTAIVDSPKATGPDVGLLETSKVVSLLTSEFLTTAEVAAVLGITKWALAGWRVERKGPPFVQLRGGTIRYPRAAFEVFLRAQLRDVHPTRRGTVRSKNPLEVR
jgi:hypothetical protein